MNWRENINQIQEEDLLRTDSISKENGQERRSTGKEKAQRKVDVRCECRMNQSLL